ncbi:hypothetical protein QJV14_03730 [Listeria cossartiae subsp. cayugensis]|uniref:lmo0954 family membrane protein n=1 Tax=Listeria cossartiae TaxID=2838249 RepID=UPI002880A521|nr:hypothetical protein [Listeria cossartiae]MDT0002581.1 hypothetical protein [Listeria cossartiae subsp. cayugensis]MDT0019051.1 hypothetical protein [Listeria cossartiae subsp. cayugensis]MDT0035376.1 hypothetical protein [Listeria cossartiae subsp. cayugensis]MDT0040801.1 hypothetical protein [Listeria cossartiae subsp. cayugensis]MDT0046078.1 hypothetical protein [Listeria cossartiae subsp. cayugensis]
MRAIFLGILIVLLIAMILIVLWPAIMATIGAVLGFWSLKKLLEASSVSEKVIYGVLIGVGALIILANLKGILVVAIIGAIIYFLTRNRNKPRKNDDVFDYPYNK